MAAQDRPQLIVPSVGVGVGADLAVSPDGKWYATSSSISVGAGNVITLWSTADGSEYRSFTSGSYDCCVDVPFGPAASISVSPDGRTIAAASGHEVHLFDVRTAKQTGTLPVSASVVRVAFHPHRNLLAVVDQSAKLSIFDPQNEQAVFQQTVDAQSFILRFSADGSLLAVGSRNAMRVFDWEHGKLLAQFDSHAVETRDLKRQLQAMVISPGSSGMQMQTAEQLGFYSFGDAAFSPSGKRLALFQRDEVVIEDLAGHVPPIAIPVESNTASGGFFVAEDKLLIGQTSNMTLEYDLAARQQSQFPAWGVKTFVPIPGTTNLLMDQSSGGFGGSVLMRSISGSGGWNSNPDMKLANSLSAAFSPDGKELLAGINWATSPMTVWSLDSGEADTGALPLQGVVRFALSHDGSLLAWYGEDAGYPDMKIYVWNRKTRTTQLSLPITVSASPECLTFSSDGSRLAAFIGSDTGSTQPKAVRIWSIPSGKVLGDIPAPSSNIVDLAWQPATSLLAIAKSDGVTLVDGGDGHAPQPLRTLNPLPLRPPLNTMPNVFSYVRFSPDGKWLAAYENGSIALMDTKTWTLYGSIPGASISNFEFSADSRRLEYFEQKSFLGASQLAFWDIASKSKTMESPHPTIGAIYSQSADGALIAGPADGGIGLVSGVSGELLATLYRVGQGSSADWLVVAPDGLFDGTPGAWNQLKWRFSGDTFDIAPVEIFFENYYHPGLLAELAQGKRPHGPADIASVDHRQPVVHLAAAADITAPLHDRMLRLNLTVEQAAPDQKHAAPSGARDLRLFRNGTLVRAWHGPLTLDAAGAAHLDAEIPIVAGENRFTAYAFSNTNIKSPDALLVVNGADQLRRKGVAWVISMGVNHYAASKPGRDLDLHFAEGDAGDFAAQFSQAQSALAQFADVRRIDLFGPHATQANLEAVFRLLAGGPATGLDSEQKSLFAAIAPVQPEDGVFLFYAGHGTAVKNHFYLIPEDYNPSVPVDDARSHAVSDADLSQMLEGISPARSFLIIDACNSGQAIDSSIPVGPMNSTGLAQLAYEKGLYILAASKDSEPALEAAVLGGGHGFLTYSLVEEGLKAGDAAIKGEVDLRPWFAYAQRRVPELQAAQMARRGLGIASAELSKEARQHPRMFYRREPETSPFVVARIFAAASAQ